MTSPSSPVPTTPTPPAPAVTIRTAPPGFAGWAALRRLILDAFAYMDGRIDPPSSAGRLTEAGMAAGAAAEAAAGTTWLLAEEPGGALVGCALLQPRGDALYVGKLAVRPDRQGRGIGAALVAAARAAARARGLAVLELKTRVELTGNQAAFARLGFREVARTAHPGFDRPTSVTMRASV